MSFKCWLRQRPFRDKVSPALESSPSLGEGRRQRRLEAALVSGKSADVVAVGDRLHLPAPCAGTAPRRMPVEPAKPWQQPLGSSRLLPAKDGSGGQPAEADKRV